MLLPVDSILRSSEEEVVLLETARVLDDELLVFKVVVV